MKAIIKSYEKTELVEKQEKYAKEKYNILKVKSLNCNTGYKNNSSSGSGLKNIEIPRPKKIVDSIKNIFNNVDSILNQYENYRSKSLSNNNNKNDKRENESVRESNKHLANANNIDNDLNNKNEYASPDKKSNFENRWTESKLNNYINNKSKSDLNMKASFMKTEYNDYTKEKENNSKSPFIRKQNNIHTKSNENLTNSNSVNFFKNTFKENSNFNFSNNENNNQKASSKKNLSASIEKNEKDHLQEIAQNKLQKDFYRYNFVVCFLDKEIGNELGFFGLSDLADLDFNGEEDLFFELAAYPMDKLEVYSEAVKRKQTTESNEAATATAFAIESENNYNNNNKETPKKRSILETLSNKDYINNNNNNNHELTKGPKRESSTRKSVSPIKTEFTSPNEESNFNNNNKKTENKTTAKTKLCLHSASINITKELKHKADLISYNHISSCEGMSGGAIFFRKQTQIYLVGLHIKGFGKFENTGILINKDKINIISEWISEHNKKFLSLKQDYILNLSNNSLAKYGKEILYSVCKKMPYLTST